MTLPDVAGSVGDGDLEDRLRDVDSDGGRIRDWTPPFGGTLMLPAIVPH